MTERERFHRLFHGKPVDRPPLLEEGIREEVIEHWRTQGMPADKSHLEIFGLTAHENIGPDIRFQPKYFGKVMDLSSREYCRAFNVSRKRFPDDWDETVEHLKNRDHIVCIWAYRGFFQALGVGNWATLEKVLYEVHDYPDRVQEFLELYGDFCARMLEVTLDDVEPDFIYLSEPISYSNGPLISPQMFERFAIPAYEKIIEAARTRGVEHILVSTYGNTAALLPAMIEAGVNILWVSEASETPEMDYLDLRRKYGPGLGLIGGIPLRVLELGSEQKMSQELNEKVTPLLQSGRYIPLCSGRVRQEIPWESYQRYREILTEIVC